MTSGIQFTAAEKAFIIAHAPNRASWGALADALAHECPGAGRHHPKSLRNWHRRYLIAADKREAIAAEVPAYLAAHIRNAGLSPAEVGALVVAGLSGAGRA